MSTTTSRAHWCGSLQTGQGGFELPKAKVKVPFSLSSRFENGEGSNPEELIGAALAGCFSMALAAEMGKQHLTPDAINTEANVQLDKENNGFTITNIQLSVAVKSKDLNENQLRSLCDTVKKNCPVSKALAGVGVINVASILK